MRASASARSTRPTCDVSSTNKPIPRSPTPLWVEVPPREEAASAEQCSQVRLLPTQVDLRFSGRVRETLSVSLQAAGLQTAEAPCRIVRHPRQHEPQRFLAKARRDLALATAEAEAVGNWPPRLLLAAGQAHGVLGDQDQAREMLRRAVEISPPRSAQRLEAFYGLLTTFDEDPDLHASQLTACLDSLEDFPFDLQLLLALGNYMLVRERLDLAIRAFEAAVRFGRITPDGLASVRGSGNCRRLPGPGLAGPAARRRGLRRSGDGAGCAARLAPLAPPALQALPQAGQIGGSPGLGRAAAGFAAGYRPGSGGAGKTGSNCGSTRAGPSRFGAHSPPQAAAVGE